MGIKNSKTVLIILIVCAIFLVQIYQSVFNYKKIEQLSKIEGLYPDKRKYILYWTKFYRAEDFNFGFGLEPFAHCPINNCFATSNKSLMPLEEYDALMFHGMEFYKFGSTSLKYGIPRNRSRNQVYIYVVYESPLNVLRINFPKDFFNWTITYRSDSDVWTPYGRIKSKFMHYKKPSIENILKRPKKIAWFVSNCNAISLRKELYVKMSQFMKIDVYGKCGKYQCERTKEKACYDLLEKDYKFYLSFENSLCEDYVTEKLFNVLKLDVVPIVYGGANYSSIVPPKSVINVNDFESVEDLMKYVIFLDENPKEYLGYFDWKNQYFVDTSNNDSLCNLCSKLHGNIKPQFYEDINDWWMGNENRTFCKKAPKILFI